MCKTENENGKTMPPISSDISVDRTDVERIVSGCLGILTKQRQQLAESFRDAIAQLGSQVVQLGTAQRQTGFAIDAVTKQLTGIAGQNQAMEAVLRENIAATEAYYQDHIIEPMVATLAVVIDLIDDTRNSWLENAFLFDRQINDLLDGIRTQLVQFFRIYGIEILQHKSGAKFNAQVMRPTKIVEIDSADLNLCIAKSLQAGFRAITSNRLLRAESVILYKCERNNINH